MIERAVGLGIILSFLFTEVTGLSAGGIIVPGYLALFLTEPQRIMATFLVAFLTYLLVKVLYIFIIVYGRRRFMAAVLIGYIIGWAFGELTTGTTYLGVDFRIIGYIVPGLIANDMLRQGVLKTIITTLFVSAVVRIILFIII